MRGARVHLRGEGGPQGIIPAHAGSTGGRAACRVRLWDHPRACGEHSGKLGPAELPAGSSPRMRGAQGAQGGGSSPRMRGARRRAPAGPHVVGIIPAHAGSTSPQSPFRLPGRDHPRACGEHRDRDGQGGRPGGSSPRMRGALLRRRMHPTRRGIIPAYAESTQGAKSLVSGAWDHPRVCGEHVTFSRVFSGSMGSSPRMRGALLCGAGRVPATGIIPAYAGSTRPTRRPPPRSRDHPRVCGEHWGTTDNDSRITGSSPRMRGAREALQGSARRSGIIPAYAGSTASSWPARRAAWDHPRVCGEHCSGRQGEQVCKGSSPRMRGALRHLDRHGLAVGIIPAYAGSTRA